MDIEFKWTSDLSVDDAIIDEQHKRLLAQLNKLLEVLAGEDKKDSVAEVILFLDKYIKEHFAYEEQYMGYMHYPELAEHTQLHKDFANRYLEFKKELEKTGPSDKLVLDVENYIGKWWLGHIGVEDKKYCVYCEKYRENK